MLPYKIVSLGMIMVLIGVCSYEIAKTTNRNQELPVISKKYGSIVRLTRNGKTFCSGTVVASDLIITAAHCIMEETVIGLRMTTEDIEVRPRNNTDLRIEAAPMFASPQMDNAVLHGDFSDFDIRNLITDPTVLTNIRKNTTKFISCGYLLNGDLYCNYTTVPKADDFAWAMEGVLLPGMSGGPTMLEDGTVVGINIAVKGDKAIVSPTYNILAPIEIK
jgi:hypothetical protein